MGDNKFTLGNDFGVLPKIVVFGVGSGGCNTVDYIYNKGVKGIELVIANTDNKSLNSRNANKKIQLGKNLTKGFGAGTDPTVGRKAAEEAAEEIENALKGTQLLFIATGMGGGTGTGAAPVIAKIAKKLDILTIAVLTKPFAYEGEKKIEYAEDGIEEMSKYVNTMIILPNDNLMKVSNKDTLLLEAFSASNDVLYLGVRGISDLITLPGLITIEFSDVKAVLEKSGMAIIGTGESDSGEDRALIAVKQALSNPLLQNVNIETATGLLVNITGGHDLTLHECKESMRLIEDSMKQKDIHMKMGTTIADEMDGKVRISIFATGIDNKKSLNNAQSFGVDDKKNINNTQSLSGVGGGGGFSHIESSTQFSERRQMNTPKTVNTEKKEVKDGKMQSQNVSQNKSRSLFEFENTKSGSKIEITQDFRGLF
ncbi:MAG: cell division protein FtsZ [Rickettsiales bacterium]|jgi:cell division protein FtsZ|nr:cell division protein FtsZ [Rickettsiales bacterium]